MKHDGFVCFTENLMNYLINKSADLPLKILPTTNGVPHLVMNENNFTNCIYFADIG